MKRWIMVIASLVCLAACSQDTEPQTDKAENHVDEVVIGHNAIENADRFQAFSKRVSQKQKDEIRIMQRTIEGDPIYQDVRFDGKKYEYTHDNREDAYGSKEVTKDSCKDFRVIETNTETTAFLEKCENRIDSITLFTLSYNAAKEDRFDFLLKYGENLEKVIDTNKVELPNKEKNIVFKNMIYINLFKDKKLEKSCSESNMQYELTVWINQGKENYNWYDCDTGKDAKDLSGLAETIIGVYEHR
ncbi:DUF4362 domain-containing protein [Fictibacillus arsenicus]|uniref:DUF4362 domain-containing protein n=1 Tax=Fictibacillus arsenicus TaxID=255247 RepID=A0A1V3G8E2_9BACL|nr:DUF4362 domain-containing protein [Fictibacillus arsenicus]OOE12670.1 hypothetical protein UN64_11430 [Fictibacillus arsenicus]